MIILFNFDTSPPDFHVAIAHTRLHHTHTHTHITPHTHTQSLEAGEGNVHSGATPPWLREEDSDDDTSTTPIGPSLDDFLKHSMLPHLSLIPRLL